MICVFVFLTFFFFFFFFFSSVGSVIQAKKEEEKSMNVKLGITEKTLLQMMHSNSGDVLFYY
jgi:hypothetical protein